MERRKALKGLAIIAAGVSFLPSCKSDVKTLNKFPKLVGLDASKQESIKGICNAILPIRNTDVTIPIATDEFLLMSLNDCYAPEDQQKYMNGFEEFSKLVSVNSSKSYADLAVEEQKAIFQEALRDQSSENLKFFARTTKGLVLRNFTTSQVFMEKYRDYKMLPGTYIACKAIS